MAQQTRNQECISEPETPDAVDAMVADDDTANIWKQSTELPRHDRSVASAVDANTQLLQTLLEQVADLRDVIVADEVDSRSGSQSIDQPACESDSETLRDRIEELETQVSELERQNCDLASQLASSSVQSVSDNSSGCNEALSWEDRKQLILQQLEDDSFDAESFVSSLQSEQDSEHESETPAEFVEHLQFELEKRDAEIARRDDELNELRFVLEQQSETREGVAIGAAAIAEMIESDELVQQERERLQLLQVEWEEKFRQGEIEASLERAKLSRERRELAKKQSELAEQLEHIRRESRQTEENGSASSRRWMVKLGLSEDS